MDFNIGPKAPYDFRLVASLYSKFSTQCVDYYAEGKYQRVLKVANKLCLATVTSLDSITKPKLRVNLTSPPPDVKEFKAQIEWILGTDEDTNGFYAIGQKDQKFAALIKDLYGLHAPRTPTVYEALIIAISEQQIALPFALVLRQRMTEKFSDFVEVDGKKYFAFPEPEALAKAKVEQFRAMKFSTKKAEYIIDISQKVASGKLDLEKMRDWEIAKTMEVLTEIRGIGPWSVEYMMVRGMARHDALPATDIGLRNGLTRYLGKTEKVSEKEVREFLEPFGKYKGLAAYYLIYSYAFKKY
jgi:DNA-3-methyladenine glycosylase II